MLILSRKKNESIIIDDDIIVTVVEIRGDRVRIGVEGPKEVPIHRKEIYEAIQRNCSEYYREFQRYLKSKQFEKSFDIFYNDREEFVKKEFPTREEVDKMVYGYQGRGED